MKVLYVSKALTTAAYRDKLRDLSELVQVTAVIPDRWGQAPVEASPPRVPEPRRVPVRLAGHNHFHFYPGARRWLDAIAPDLVHIDEEPYSLVTLQLARLCRRRRIPYVFFTWQNLERRLPPPFGRLRSAVFAGAAGGIAGTAAAAAILRAWGFAGPLAVIPQFGVDPERFRPDPAARAEARAGLELPADAFVVGYGGRLIPEKGVHVLIDAAARLPAPNGATAGRVHLLVVGGGAERDRLRDRADSRGLGSRATFAGPRSSLEMPGLLAAMDVLVLPSLGTRTWTEQFGRIVVEAMACGVPVIGSRCGELPSVIGDAGDLVPPGDADALAAALDRLRADPAFRRRRGEEGRARVLERYTQAEVARGSAEFYRELLRAGKGAT